MHTWYAVRGGVYEDSTFSNLIPFTFEYYGPYRTKEEAYQTWSSKARANIDDCCHRLTIVNVYMNVAK